MSAGIKYKAAGVWKNVNKAFVKAGGSWHECQFVYAKQDGVWRDVTPGIILEINADTQNYNLKTEAMAAGWDGLGAISVQLTIGAGVSVTSNSVSVPALDTGTGWPVGCEIVIINNGAIIGMGGRGGNANGGAGEAGGPALKAQTAITVINNGTIAGGGGGGGAGGYRSITTTTNIGDNTTTTTKTYGGGGGGGGRSGRTNSAGGSGGGGTYYGYAGAAGTYDAAGYGMRSGSGPDEYHPDGGYGGDWGMPGLNGASSTSAGGVGGTAGKYVIGNANVTWQVAGTLLGGVA